MSLIPSLTIIVLREDRGGDSFRRRNEVIKKQGTK
jgi:hypothetical protein